MRRTWNIDYLLMRAARGLFALLVVPAGVALALMLSVLWLIWLATSALQGALMAFTAEPARPSSRQRPLRGPGKLQLTLPVRGSSDREVPKPLGPQRLSAVDLDRSLTAMARHGWPKARVMAALKAAGASWVWSEADGAEERVHVRYRQGEQLISRYMMPATQIHLFFDAAGRLANAHVQRLHRL